MPQTTSLHQPTNQPKRKTEDVVVFVGSIMSVAHKKKKSGRGW